MKITTLNKHIISTFGVEQFHGGVFTILREIVFVAKLMHREINKAGIVQDILGGTGEKKLSRRPDSETGHFCK